MTHLVAVDAGATDVGGAEHVVATLDALLPATHPSYVASTHVVPGGRVAVVASWDDGATHDEVGAAVSAAVPGADVVVGADDGSATDALREAVAQHQRRAAGRLVRFAGRTSIEDRVTVAEVLGATCVEEVRAVGSAALPHDTVVDLREWARPVWQAGRTVLLLQPAREGLVPFESRHQIACCSNH